MTRSSSTLILTAALAAACSKPNPLFLDTWGELSDGGTSASTLTGEPMTTTTWPTTGTTEPPPTTGPGTTTTGDVTTGGPTSEGTTGEPFFCNADMDGCCEVRLEPEADNFFTDAVDGVAPMEAGCPFVVNPPAEYAKLLCSKWSFGRVPSLGLFNDYDGWVFDPNKNSSVMALRFPMKDGRLLADGVPIPWEVVELLMIEIAIETDWGFFSDFVFDLYGLPAELTWTEGDGPGAVPCTGGNSCYNCRACGATPEECAEPWPAQKPLDSWIAKIEAASAQPFLQMVVPDPQSLAAAPGGLVLVPTGVTFEGEARSFVPSGTMIANARESTKVPSLRVKVCMK